MENPTFRLEGVVKTRDAMEDFEGPLNLILLLLSKNKIEIEDIRISVILEQYLTYLDQMKRMDLEIASEFVAMASHLVYIKTKTLLAGGEEVSEMELLIRSLEEMKSRDSYVRVQEVLEELQALWNRGSGYLPKPPEPIQADRPYGYVHDGDELRRALTGLFEREEGRAYAPGAPFMIPQPMVCSVTEKAAEILSYLKGKGPALLQELLRMNQSRPELVAAFVAVLELCRTGSLRIADTEEGSVVRFTGFEPPPIPEGFE